MTRPRINLNADLGESFGAWTMGRDAEMLQVVDSANVACGFHAGDPLVMRQTVATAKRHGVSIGAHPSFPDLQGFGRRRIDMAPAEVEAMVVYQIGALQGIAAAERHRVTPRQAAWRAQQPGLREPRSGALHRTRGARCRAGTDPAGAGAVGAGARPGARPAWPWSRRSSPTASTPTKATWCRARTRRPWCTAPRPACATSWPCSTARALVSIHGKRLPCAAGSICVHGDNAEAVATAQAVRAALQAAGYALRAPARAGRLMPALQHTLRAALAGAALGLALARRSRCRLRHALCDIAAVLGRRLRVPERAEPEGAAFAAAVEDLDALPAAGRPGQHAGGSDPAAQARPRPARRAGRVGQPCHPARPFVAPAQAARQVLADRPGVRRASLAGELCRAEALPPAADRAERAAADRRPVPVARPLRPPRPADHRIPARPGAALLRAAGRGPAPARHGRGGRAHPGVRLVAGRQPCRASASARCRRSISPAARCGTATARCGSAGSSKAAASASSTPAIRATSPASSRLASASAASTWR